jgi:hypothetical protein
MLSVKSLKIVDGSYPTKASEDRSRSTLREAVKVFGGSLWEEELNKNSKPKP